MLITWEFEYSIQEVAALSQNELCAGLFFSQTHIFFVRPIQASFIWLSRRFFFLFARLSIRQKPKFK